MYDKLQFVTQLIEIESFIRKGFDSYAEMNKLKFVRHFAKKEQMNCSFFSIFIR